MDIPSMTFDMDWSSSELSSRHSYHHNCIQLNITAVQLIQKEQSSVLSVCPSIRQNHMTSSLRAEFTHPFSDWGKYVWWKSSINLLMQCNKTSLYLHIKWLHYVCRRLWLNHYSSCLCSFYCHYEYLFRSYKNMFIKLIVIKANVL